MTYAKLAEGKYLDEKKFSFEDIKMVLKTDSPVRISRAIEMIQRLHHDNFTSTASDEDIKRLKEVVDKAAEQILVYVEESLIEIQKKFDAL